LEEHKNNPVDVLSGAFMLMRKSVLDKTGGFDEQFFMYAEDIDLSYRVQKAGYINYYVADTTIIHFKGESTRKDSNYVKLFYKAMDQFMRKHISTSPLALLFMKMAVWFRSRITSLAYLFPQKKINKKKYGTFIEGDKINVNLLKSSLPSIDRTIVQNPQESNEIIFCEGAELSFKEIIRMIQQKKYAASFKIHAGNSSSVVGSDSKDKNGEAFAIN
jgi:GT2 family glycosyltransferase